MTKLTILCFIVCALFSHANPLGLLESYESLISIYRKNFIDKTRQIALNPKSYEDLKEVKDIKIDQDFLVSLLIHTPKVWWHLVPQNANCELLLLFEAGLLRGPEGPINNIIIQFTNSQNKPESAMISLDVFSQLVTQPLCPNIVAQKQTLKDPNNLIQEIKKFVRPFSTKKDQCMNEYESLLRETRTAYFCATDQLIKSRGKLNEQLREKTNLRTEKYLRSKLASIDFLEKNINKDQLLFLNNLCDSLNTPEKFCEDYINASFWNKISSGKKESNIINPFCEKILGKENSNKNSTLTCLKRLSQSPETCHLFDQDYLGLIPAPNCSIISTAQNHSRLFQDYKDCPGFTEDLSILNFSRLSRHFNKQSASYHQQYCSSNSLSSLQELSTRVNNPDFWDNNVCYFDKFLGKDRCWPSFFSLAPKSALSLDDALTSLMRKKMESPKLRCSLIQKSQYRPSLLKFKTGCYIIQNDQFCTAINCTPQVIYNGEVQKDIKFHTKYKIEYFASDYKNQSFALNDTFLRDSFKSTRPILNYSILKTTLESNPNAILHGIACLEDIYPSFFQKRSLGQCQATPFIIDGFIDRGDKYSLVIRTAIDTIHAPRLIDWNFLFSALKNYQQLSPKNQWSFHGIY